MNRLGKHLLDTAFGRPRGLLGRAGGALMARGNAGTEQHLVELARLEPHEVALVLGPGPGMGLRTAAEHSSRVHAVDPSELMLSRARRRCADLVADRALVLALGDAEHTGQPTASVDVVLSVNNVQLWGDWAAGFTEQRRVLRPGGRMLLSAHHKWLPGGLGALADAVHGAGFIGVETWTWTPPGRGATEAAQLRAICPSP